MQTFRADIDVTYDNIRRRKRNILFMALAFVILLSSFAYFQTRYYLMDGLPKLPDKATMWQLNLKPNITLLDKKGRLIGHRGPFCWRAA